MQGTVSCFTADHLSRNTQSMHRLSNSKSPITKPKLPKLCLTSLLSQIPIQLTLFMYLFQQYFCDVGKCCYFHFTCHVNPGRAGYHRCILALKNVTIQLQLVNEKYLQLVQNSKVLFQRMFLLQQNSTNCVIHTEEGSFIF